jgi:NDP-sugar pyrophosphorylase family protein
MVRNSTRFITTAKIPVDKLDERKYHITFVILAATQNTRINSDLPVPLLPVNKQIRLIDKQYDTIRKLYQYSDIYLGVGYRADEIYRYVQGRIKTIENERFAKTGATRTLSLLLRAIHNSHVIILDGNVIFDIDFIYNLSPSHSSIITSNILDKSKIGVVSHDNIVTDFSFGSPQKWCKLSHITGNDLTFLQKVVHDKSNEHLSLFESFEQMINNGGTLHTVECSDSRFSDIDSMASVKKITQ